MTSSYVETESCWSSFPAEALDFTPGSNTLALMVRLVLPFLLLLASVLGERLWAREALSESLLERASWVVFGLVFLLAWRFRRGRTAWAVALLAAVATALAQAPLGAFERHDVLVLSSFLVPLVLAAAAVLGELLVLSTAGAWRFGGLAGLALGAAALWTEIEAWLMAPLPGAAPAWLVVPPLPPLATPVFLAAALVLAVQLARHRTPHEAGLLAALGTTWLALADPWGGEATAAFSAGTWYLAAGGLVLGVALVEQTFALAFEDGLTGLPARRALEETLDQLGRQYAIAMVDLDHFKRFNDRHGHEVGDQVLQMVAARLGRVGGGGRAFRYGGEEFSVVFPGKTAAAAEPFMEELRKTVAEAPFVVRSPGRPKKKPKGAKSQSRGTKSLRVTVSIGLAERGAEASTPEEVMKAADKALYRAKRAGRNRVMVGR